MTCPDSSEKVCGVPTQTKKEPNIAADYTTRSAYQKNYRNGNRDAINARKRVWKQSRKLLCTVATPIDLKRKKDR